MSRTIPHDVETERSLIATLAAPGALDPGSSSADCHHALLSACPEFFLDPRHRAVFEALQGCYAEAIPVSTITLKHQLEQMRSLSRVGGLQALSEILQGEEVTRPSVLVQRLADLWRSRRLLRLAARLAEQAADTSTPVDALVAEASSELSQLARGKDSSRIRPASDLLDRIEAGEPFRAPGSTGKLAWLGLPGFDEELECAPEHVVIVAARPGVGKSAMAIQAQWATARKGVPSLLVSLEMNRDEVESRYAAWQSGTGQRAWRAGRWPGDAAFGLLHEREVLGRMHHWCAPSNAPWPTVEAVIRDAVRSHGVRVVVIDHVLLLAKPNLGRSSTDASCWTALSRSIKRLAQELSICVVSLCQLNRAGDGVEPKLSDLKESGGWEEDANAVLMLWPANPRAVDRFEECRAVLAKAAKNRSGASGWKRELEFYGATSRFVEPERCSGSSLPVAVGYQEDLL